MSNSDGIFELVPKSECNPGPETKEMRAKLILSKTRNKVVYMECDEDVVDILFSFLALPLGSIIKLLDKNSSIGHADKLYRSAVDLSLHGNDCIRFKNLIISPKLAPFFGVKKQLLKIEEEVSVGGYVMGCYACDSCSRFPCIHGTKEAALTELNPKSSKNTTESGGGYAKGLVKFMVTDDLNVAPLSSSSVIRIIHERQVRISDLVEKEVSIGEAQVT